MKKLLLLSGLLLVISCGKKEVKKEEPIKKVEVKKDTVKPVEKVAKKVVKKDPVITFTVQVGAFEKYGQSFSKIPNVIQYQVDGMTKYGLKSFKTVREAVNFMYSIEEDYPDCFVQALKDGKPIHISEALK